MSRPVTERPVTALRDAVRFRRGQTPRTRLALHSRVPVGAARPERPTVGEAQKIAHVEGPERMSAPGHVRLPRTTPPPVPGSWLGPLSRFSPVFEDRGWRLHGLWL